MKSRNLDIDGKKITAEFIGKGLFCKAYRHGDIVYLLVDGDYSKEAIALFADKSLPHIPQITQHNGFKDYQVFSMPFYHRLTKRDYPKAYADWLTLPPMISGEYHGVIRAIDACKTTDGIKDALRELVECFLNYEHAGIVLEFNRANMGVDNNGNLILRDCLASSRSIQEKRRNRYHS